ncbi:MAG: polyphenol oxidase family protein [Treponema sp.]|jgi:YfiH family protein|nr:polyphenol oxidase family protein [Treponema sp.]
MLHITEFNLEFNADRAGRPFFASFPFMYGGVPLGEIKCGISSRFAGDMVYAEGNPARCGLFAQTGLEPARVYGLNQIHSREVLAVDRHNPPHMPADGMVSNDRDIALSVTVADCLPVYLLDPDSGAFGLLHSGWKGTGIVLRALALMAERWSTRPEAVAAVLGPCIGPCCYTVDNARAAAFDREFGSLPLPARFASGNIARFTVTRQAGAQWYIDLKAANIRLLAGAGIQNIAVCANCTFCDERLGSYRREGLQCYTRMAAVVFAG